MTESLVEFKATEFPEPPSEIRYEEIESQRPRSASSLQAILNSVMSFSIAESSEHEKKSREKWKQNGVEEQEGNCRQATSEQDKARTASR